MDKRAEALLVESGILLADELQQLKRLARSRHTSLDDILITYEVISCDELQSLKRASQLCQSNANSVPFVAAALATMYETGGAFEQCLSLHCAGVVSEETDPMLDLIMLTLHDALTTYLMPDRPEWCVKPAGASKSEQPEEKEEEEEEEEGEEELSVTDTIKLKPIRQRPARKAPVLCLNDSIARSYIDSRPVEASPRRTLFVMHSPPDEIVAGAN